MTYNNRLAGLGMFSSSNQCYKHRRYIGNIVIYRDVNSLAIYWQYIAPIFSRFFLAIFPDFLAIFADFFQYTVIFFFFCIFYFADILPMFADIFADKSDNFFLDHWRYIRRHNICNIAFDTA